VSRRSMTREELAALFMAKAAEAPPAANLILARHLQCKESCDLSSAVAEATPTLCRNRQDSAAGATRTAFPTGVMTLAPAFSQALPSLVGVRADYTHEPTGNYSFSCVPRWCMRDWVTRIPGSRLAAVRFDLPNPP